MKKKVLFSATIGFLSLVLIVGIAGAFQMHEVSAEIVTVDGSQLFWEKVSVKGGAASFNFNNDGRKDWCILARIVDDGRGDRGLLEKQRSRLCDKIVFRNDGSIVDIYYTNGRVETNAVNEAGFGFIFVNPSSGERIEMKNLKSIRFIH